VDLIFSAEVRDSSNTVCTTCAAGVALDAWAVASNPCANDITLQLNAPDFISGGSLTAYSSGMGMGWAVGGSGGAMTVTVPAGGQFDEANSMGRLSVDTYDLSLSLTDRAGTTVTTTFDVR